MWDERMTWSNCDNFPRRGSSRKPLLDWSWKIYLEIGEHSFIVEKVAPSTTSPFLPVVFVDWLDDLRDYAAGPFQVTAYHSTLPSFLTIKNSPTSFRPQRHQGPRPTSSFLPAPWSEMEDGRSRLGWRWNMWTLSFFMSDDACSLIMNWFTLCWQEQHRLSFLQMLPRWSNDGSENYNNHDDASILPCIENVSTCGNNGTWIVMKWELLMCWY